MSTPTPPNGYMGNLTAPAAESLHHAATRIANALERIAKAQEQPAKTIEEAVRAEREACASLAEAHARVGSPTAGLALIIRDRSTFENWEQEKL